MFQPMSIPPQQPTFAIVKSYMVESGTYNPMYTRPYTTTLDQNGLNNFMEVTQGGRNINRYTLAPIANTILSTAAQPDAQVTVENGWQERRIIFMMEIAQVGTGLSTVISGYADRVDLSLSGILDPYLKLVINSSLTLSASQQQTPTGGVMTVKRVVDNGHILGQHTLSSVLPIIPQAPNDFGFGNGNHVYLQRPMDVANNLSLGFYADSVTLDGRTEVIPGRNERSSRANNVVSEYLAATVNSLRDIDKEGVYQAANYSKNEVYSDAASKMRETNVTSDGVMRYILNNSNLNTMGHVTWQQFTTMFPDLDAMTEYFTSSSVPVELTNGSHFNSAHGNFEYWHNTSYEAMFASTILQMIPAIMSQLMLTGYSGMFTNNTIDGSYQVMTTDARSFIDGFDRTQSIQMLEKRIVDEVLPGITNGNTRLVDITVNLSLIRDGYISVSIEGGYPVEFSAPMWGDGLYIPTISTNKESLSLISGTVSALVGIN